MSFSHIHTLAINDGSGQITKNNTYTAGAVDNIDESIPNSTTNGLVAFALTVAKLKSLYMVSDAVITVKTNSSGSPQETIALAAGCPLVWNSSDGYFACPFSGDVTKLYVTNTSGGAAQLQIRTIVDPT